MKIKRWLMEAINKMCNIQRDRHLNPREQHKRAVRKGRGEFAAVLKEEEDKRKGGERSWSTTDCQKPIWERRRPTG